MDGLTLLRNGWEAEKFPSQNVQLSSNSLGGGQLPCGLGSPMPISYQLLGKELEGKPEIWVPWQQLSTDPPQPQVSQIPLQRRVSSPIKEQGSLDRRRHHAELGCCGVQGFPLEALSWWQNRCWGRKIPSRMGWISQHISLRSWQAFPLGWETSAASASPDQACKRWAGHPTFASESHLCEEVFPFPFDLRQIRQGAEHRDARHCRVKGWHEEEYINPR